MRNELINKIFGRKRKGSVIVAVTLLIVILTGMSIILLTSALQSNFRTNDRRRDLARAFYAAEAGVNLVQHWSGVSSSDQAYLDCTYGSGLLFSFTDDSSMLLGNTTFGIQGVTGTVEANFPNLYAAVDGQTLTMTYSDLQGMTPGAILTDANGGEYGYIQQLDLSLPTSDDLAAAAAIGGSVPQLKIKSTGKSVNTVGAPNGVTRVVEALVHMSPFLKATFGAALVSNNTGSQGGNARIHWGEGWLKSAMTLPPHNDLSYLLTSSSDYDRWAKYRTEMRKLSAAKTFSSATNISDTTNGFGSDIGVDLGGNMTIPSATKMTMQAETFLATGSQLRGTNSGTDYRSTLNSGTKLYSGTTLSGTYDANGNHTFTDAGDLAQTIPSASVIPASTSIPAWSIFPSSTVLANTTVIPSGTVVPNSTTLPSGEVVPAGTTWPAGSSSKKFPNGTVLPAGTVFPAGSKLNNSNYSGTLAAATTVSNSTYFGAAQTETVAITLGGSMQLNGNMTLGANMTLTGSTTLGGTMQIANAMTLPSALTLPGALTLGPGTFTVGGSAQQLTLGGTLTVRADGTLTVGSTGVTGDTRTEVQGGTAGAGSILDGSYTTLADGTVQVNILSSSLPPNTTVPAGTVVPANSGLTSPIIAPNSWGWGSSNDLYNTASSSGSDISGQSPDPRLNDIGASPATGYAGKFNQDYNFGTLSFMDINAPTNYQAFKNFAMASGTYYYTDSSGNIYKGNYPNGTLVDFTTEFQVPDGVNRDNAAFGFYFIDTTDRQPPAADGSNLSSISVSGTSNGLKGLMYIAANFTVQGSGSPGQFTMKKPSNTDADADGVPDTFTNVQPSDLTGNPKIWLDGVLLVSGTLSMGGNAGVYGCVVTDKGFVGGGTPDIFYNWDLRRGLVLDPGHTGSRFQIVYQGNYGETQQ